MLGHGFVRSTKLWEHQWDASPDGLAAIQLGISTQKETFPTGTRLVGDNAGAKVMNLSCTQRIG